eukprot:266915_1
MNKLTGEQTDFQTPSQMKYHHLLNSLKISTKAESIRIQDQMETEPGYRSPSTDSPRAIPYATDDSPVAEESHDNMLILLDWDDTLFPTAWLTEILQNTKNGVALVNDEEIALLNRLGDITVSFLSDLIVKYGPANVAIVTNSLQGWIGDSLNYASCISPQYKELELLLHKHDITMDSARSLYAKQEQSSTPTKWKQLCFDSILNGTKTQPDYRHIVSIGDQWTDHYATKQSIASLTAYSPIHHMIKLKPKPNVGDMINEMLYVQTCFTHIFDVLSSSRIASEPIIVDYHREELKHYDALNVNK